MRKTIFLVVMLFLFVSCSEKKENAQGTMEMKNQEAEAPVNKILLEDENSMVEVSMPMDGRAPVEMDEKQLDSLVDLKVKKAMEKEPFKTRIAEVKRFNDSLDQIKENKFPHEPGPEGVLKLLYRNCLKKGNCPNE